MKLPKKLLSVLLAGSSLLGAAGIASAQEAGPPPSPTTAVEMQNTNPAAPTVTQADVDNFAYNVGVQTAFPLAREGFSQGTLRNGQYVGLQFVLDGNNKATGYSVYNLEDQKSQVAFQQAIDNASQVEQRLENQRYNSGYSTPVYYPESYVIVTPVIVPPLWGFGWGFGHYRIGFWEPVIWPGFVYMGGMGYHGGYGGWGHGHYGGVRNDIRNTTVINNTTIINNGHGHGQGDNGHWATGRAPLPGGVRGTAIPQHERNNVTGTGTFDQHHQINGTREFHPFNQASGIPQVRNPQVDTHRFDQPAQRRFETVTPHNNVQLPTVHQGAVDRGSVWNGAAGRGTATGNVRMTAPVIRGNPGGGGGHHR